MRAPTTPAELLRVRAESDIEMRLPLLAEQCPIWARLAAKWEQICIELEFECPYGRGHAPNTRRVLEECST